jgi:hypothetical protein
LPPATDHHIGTRVYGPFSRLKAAKGQTAATVVKQALSGEIWGETPRYGATPAVQAYGRGLRPGESGIEFYAFAPPDTRWGSPYWRTENEHLAIEKAGGRAVAKLRVAFVRITQDLLDAADQR